MQLSYQLGLLMTLVLVRNVPFSFLIRPSPSLVLSFGTSESAFMAGLLPSSLLFFVSAPFASAVHLLLMSEPPLMVTG